MSQILAHKLYCLFDTLKHVAMAGFLLWLSWLLLSLLSIYLLGLLAHTRRRLPPGPRPLPLIGSLHLLGDQPHRSLAGLAKMYGPLMSLRLGAVTTVVASSPEVAREFLQKHDAVFATRSTPDAVRDHGRNSVPWLPPGPRWRELRKIMATELFSTSRLDALHELRQEKVAELVDHVARLAREGAAVDIGRVAFTTSLNLIACTIFSRDLTSLDDHGASKEFQRLITDVMEAVGSPNLSDFFPALAAVDLQGWRRRVSGLFARLHRLFDAEVDHRRLHGMKENDGDFLEVLLRLAARDKDAAGLDGDTLRSLFTDLFGAGSDTSSSTVEWAMTELLRNPLSMAKLCDELRRLVGSRRRIEECDIGQLPYLQAVIKETFRLHSPVPLLLPRQATRTIQIMGYTIPKGTRVLINVWAMGRDENIWSEAGKFMPERFLERTIDYKGGDLELIPFGAGRRICPGMPLAIRMVHILLASLLIHFKWRLPAEVEENSIDMTEKFGVTLAKANHLCAMAIPT
uniref:Cytochrome P450 n=1 Tax=Oryza punctata TaxID=4537 RepID=A0A0E0LTV1_ORYPU